METTAIGVAVTGVPVNDGLATCVQRNDPAFLSHLSVPVLVTRTLPATLQDPPGCGAADAIETDVIPSTATSNADTTGRPQRATFSRRPLIPFRDGLLGIRRLL